MTISLKKVASAIAVVLFIQIGFAQVEAQMKEKKKEIVAYYPNWQQYKRGGMFHQKNLDFSKYTIVEYSFMGLSENGDIELVDPWGDGLILDGEIDWSLTTDEEDPIYVPYSNMIGLAHKEGTKVMLSLGGWTLSTNFPIVAADPVKRARLAQSCVEVCRKYDFDGIDLDWEFPGASPGNGCEGGPEDKENFNLLCDIIRDSLNVYEEEVGQKMHLTAAFHSVPYLAQQIDWEHVSQVLDYVNLFGYDFYGAWYPQANHNAPLYAPKVGDFGVNQADGFMLLTEVYGVPADKIILGIGFYGRSMKDLKEKKLFADHPGLPDMDNFPLHEGSPAYFEIIEKYPEYDVMWDDDAKVPYMLGKKSNSFVGYDDLVSVQYKAAFICQQGAAGCLIWEMSQDLVEVPQGSGNIGGSPLIDVINEVFENYEQTGSYEAYGNKIDLKSTEEMKESYFERESKVEKKQEGYTQDSVEELNNALEAEADSSKATDTTSQALKVEETVISEEGNMAQNITTSENTEVPLKEEEVSEFVSEDQKEALKDLDLSDDNAAGAMQGVVTNKNEVRNGEHLFEPGSLDILFGRNSTELDAAAKQNIKTSAKFIVSTNMDLILTGYSSSDGNAAFNKQLAKDRVAIVKEYLLAQIKYYAEANDISIDGQNKVTIASGGGSTKSFGSNAQLNRRVTISYETK